MMKWWFGIPGSPQRSRRSHNQFCSPIFVLSNACTPDSGQVTLTHPLGNYRFHADENGTQFWSGANNLCPVPGCTSAAITVSVPVVILVRDTDGVPGVGLPVYAYSGTTYMNYNGTTSASGQVTFTLPAGNYRFRADKNGNPSASSGQALLNDGEKSYTYDQANRLTNVSANGLNWSASYNGDGARLRQVSNGVPTIYTLDPSLRSGQALAAPLVQVLAQQDAAGTTTYLYGVMRIGEQQPGGVPLLTVAFTDTSAAPTSITGWQWSFGDGVTGSSRISSFTIGPISAVADSPRAR